MSSISRSPSGKWWVRWRDPDGTQRTKTFVKNVHAKNFKTELDNRLARGMYIDPKAGEVTFAEYAETWRLAQDHRPLTANNVERSLRLHVYPVLGHRPIGQVRTIELQQWAKQLGDVLAPSTVETVSRYVATIFRAAHRDRVIAFTPTAGWKRSRVSSSKIVPPTPDEIMAVAGEIMPRYRAIVLVMAGTGLRSGEAFGLRDVSIDRGAPSIEVDRQLITVENVVSWGPPKTDSSARVVPVIPELLDVIDAHVDRFGLGPDGVLFTNTRGDWIARHQFGAAWRTAANRAGVVATPHGCRHSFASILIEAGESVRVIQDRLGHSDPTLTLSVYGHLWPESDQKTRDIVSDAYGALFSPSNGCDV